MALRHRAVPITAAVVAVVLVGGCGSSAATPSTPATSAPSASTIFVLTSPAPLLSVPFTDPSAPAFVEGSGFTPDATRVLTVASLQLALERYKAGTGSYPASLGDLFPGYAPLGPGGKAMAGPPAASDGYTYAVSGSGYTLSVVLTGGQAYSVGAPERP